jgi:hypothetical protein
VEQRCQVLDVAAPDTQLVLAAAIRAYAPFVAVVVRAEELRQATEARRLDVHHLGREGQRLDVGDRMDRRVPRDAVSVGLEHRIGLVVDRRVLEPRIGERLGQELVLRGVRRVVHHGPAVVALQVKRVDDAHVAQLADQLLGPRRRRVELEAQRRVLREERAQLGRGRGFAGQAG